MSETSDERVQREAREGKLVFARIKELYERPIQGQFDLDHLKATHAYIFQDLAYHRPGQVRADTTGWSKYRMLEGQPGVHEVHYAHENVAGRIDQVLRDLRGPAAFTGLDRDAAASRMARFYGDLDHAHGFHEGNSRTLREFTRSLALASGFELDWAKTNVAAEQRNSLYVARDVAVLERAFPGLTPQRGMETNDRAEYEASLALPGLRRRGSSLEAIIRDGLTPLPSAPHVATAAGPASGAQRSISDLAMEALARYQQRDRLASPERQATSIADRTAHQEPTRPTSSSDTVPKREQASPRSRSDYGPSP